MAVGKTRRTGLLLFVVLAPLILRCSGGEPPKPPSDKTDEDSLEATPNYYANIALQRGNQYLRRGEYATALESYKRALGYNPELARAHCSIGYVHYLKGEYEDAENKFKITIEIDPRYVGAYFYLGKVYDNKGAVDMAIEHYEKALDISPKYASAYFFLGRDYEKKGEVKKALRAYRHYLRYAPDGDGAGESRAAIERLKRRRY